MVDLALYPGDTITSVRPTGSTITDGIICVLHASPVSNMVSTPAERLLWLEQDMDI